MHGVYLAFPLPCLELRLVFDSLVVKLTLSKTRQVLGFSRFATCTITTTAIPFTTRRLLGTLCVLAPCLFSCPCNCFSLDIARFFGKLFDRGRGHLTCFQCNRSLVAHTTADMTASKCISRFARAHDRWEYQYAIMAGEQCTRATPQHIRIRDGYITLIGN